MPRQDTKLECEGAEFLVLGQLLIHGIAAYKTYTNMPGYDLIATNPQLGTSVRIQVKSRWRTDANGFIIKNFDCEFVVVAKLNRGRKDGKLKVMAPEFYVLPSSLLRTVRRSIKMNRVQFKDIPDFGTYQEKWSLISESLKRRI